MNMNTHNPDAKTTHMMHSPNRNWKSEPHLSLKARIRAIFSIEAIYSPNCSSRSR